MDEQEANFKPDPGSSESKEEKLSPPAAASSAVDVTSSLEESNVSSATPSAGMPPTPLQQQIGGNMEGATATPAAVSIHTLPKKTPNDFIFGKLLGDGSFSSVYLAKDVKTSIEFAIKVCQKKHIIKEKKADSIKREKEVLTILSENRSPTSPYFVRLYATFQDDQRLYFVVTYAPGGELLTYLHKVGAFDLPCCQFYSAEILQALRHLHSIGIVHRDLKPENILLNEHGHILVTDFGSAKIISLNQTSPPTQTNSLQSPSSSAQSSVADQKDGGGAGRGAGGGTGGGADSVSAIIGASRSTRASSFVGTAQYVSPEVLQGRYREVGPPADLWAFGCILFQLISGVLPFKGAAEYFIFQKILTLEYQFPSGFPPIVKDLVEKLLRMEPMERLGAADHQIYQSIQTHPFFKGVNFDTLSEQVPPTIVSNSGEGKSPSVKSKRPTIPEDYEPGFDPRVIAERDLKHERDSFQNSMEEEDSDLDDEPTAGDQVSDGLEKLNVAGDGASAVMIVNQSSAVAGKGRSLSVGHGTPASRPIQLPKNESERRQRLEEQLRLQPQYHAAVKGNLILKLGLVNKKKGLFARRRLLLLTEGPHLYYCEPNSLNVKGEIPWSKQLKTEVKDFRFFFVHTPNRTYNLEDPGGYALEWCRAINEVYHHVYAKSTSTGTLVSSTSSNQQ